MGEESELWRKIDADDLFICLKSQKVQVLHPLQELDQTSHGLKPYSHYLQSLTKQNFKNHWKYHDLLVLHLWKSITWEAAEFLKRKALGKNLYTIWSAPYIHQFLSLENARDIMSTPQ